MNNFSNIKGYENRPLYGVRIRTQSLAQNLFDPEENYEKTVQAIEEAYRLGTDLLFLAGPLFENKQLAFLQTDRIFRETIVKLNKKICELSQKYRGLNIVYTTYNEFNQLEFKVIEGGKNFSTSPLNFESQEHSLKSGIIDLPLYQVDGKIREIIRIGLLAEEEMDEVLNWHLVSQAQINILLLSKTLYREAGTAYTSTHLEKIHTSLTQLKEVSKAYIVFASPSSSVSNLERMTEAIHYHSLAQDIVNLKQEKIEDEEELILDSFCDLEKQKHLLNKHKIVDKLTIEPDIFKPSYEQEVEGRSQENISLPSMYPLDLKIAKNPFLEMLNEQKRDETLESILQTTSNSLAKRLKRTKIDKLVLGLSGGLDSCLATLISLRSLEILGLPKQNLYLYTLPCFGTSERTLKNVDDLATALEVEVECLSIKEAVLEHFSLIKHDETKQDKVYENSQARERTQVLMDLANQKNALVLGTGDASELALGWCTYNGDHISMFSVNASIPKTLIAPLLEYEGKRLQKKHPSLLEALHNIVATPISPELIPASSLGQIQQKTEDVLGDYALHDFFLYYQVFWQSTPASMLFYAEQAFVKTGIYSFKFVYKTLETFYRRWYTQQFKRACSPEGVDVQAWSLSPRSKLLFPADISPSFILRKLKEAAKGLSLE